MTIVAVGKSAFLARAVRDKNPKDWFFLSHDDALKDTSWAKTASAVVNFAFSPALRTGEYDAAEDIDSKLAALSPAHYIMASSRAAYGPVSGDFGLREEQEAKPATAYGRNKLAIEKSLLKTLGPRLTILRPSNIFGHERGRATFFGLSLSTLAEKKTIIFDMNPAQKRDFLAAWHFADAIIKIAAKPVPGLFNLGAGYATPCGDIAAWLIEGYGEGKLQVNDTGKDEQFWLDMTKTRAAYGLPVISADTLKQDCIAVGRRLKASGVSRQ